MQAVHTFVLNLQGELPPMSILALLVGSIIHDYGHPGVNNQFLYRIMDPDAIRYNGLSVTAFVSVKFMLGRFWKTDIFTTP